MDLVVAKNIVQVTGIRQQAWFEEHDATFNVVVDYDGAFAGTTMLSFKTQAEAYDVRPGYTFSYKTTL